MPNSIIQKNAKLKTLLSNVKILHKRVKVDEIGENWTLLAHLYQKTAFFLTKASNLVIMNFCKYKNT